MRFSGCIFLFFLPLSFFSQATSAGYEDSLLTLLKKSGQDTARAILLHNLAEFNRTLDPVKAFNYAKEQKLLSEKLNFKKGTASALRSFANWHFTKGNMDSAIFYDQLSVQQFLDLKMNRAAVLGHMNIARCYSLQGKKQEAVDKYFEVLRLSEKMRDTFCINRAYNALGTFYFHLQENEKARSYYEKQLALVRPEDPQAAVALVSIGSTWLEQKNYEQALVFYNKAYAAIKGKNDRAMEGILLANMSVVMAEQINPDKKKIISNYKEAIKIFEELPSAAQLAGTSINLGNYYLQQKMYTEAIEVGQKALDLTQKTNHTDEMILAFELLMNVYHEQGNFEKAFDYQKRFVALKDSVLNLEKTTAIAELEAKYQDEKKQIEIINLQKDVQARDLKDSRKNLQIILLLSGIVLVLAIGGFAFILLRNRYRLAMHKDAMRHKQMQMAAILETQEEERRRIAKDLHDGVGQLLAGLKISLQHLSNTNNLQNVLSQPSEVLDEAAREVRSISHQMMPRVLEESGLIPAIEGMLNNTFRNSSIQYEFEHSSIDGRFGRDIEINLFRALQEITNNILKHAQATHVSYQLFKNGKVLLLVVEDNGKGLDENANLKTGHGLMNIQGRIKSIGGEVSFEPGPGKGLVTTIRIPLE